MWAISKPPDLQVTAPSGTTGDWETAGSRLEPDFGNLRASQAASKSAFWIYWETAVFGQILAGSLSEPDFGTLRASGSLWEARGKLRANSRKPPCPCVKRAAAREHQGTSVFRGQIFPVGRVEPDAVFGHFEALFCVSEAWNVVSAA